MPEPVYSGCFGNVTLAVILWMCWKTPRPTTHAYTHTRTKDAVVFFFITIFPFLLFPLLPFLAGIRYCCRIMQKASFVYSLYCIYSLIDDRSCLSLTSLLYGLCSLAAQKHSERFSGCLH